MKTGYLSLTLIVAMTATIPMVGAAYASTPSHGHEMQHAASQMKHEAFGVLKAVNPGAGEVQLAHEAIPSLHWPSMTMWFALHGTLPKEIKVGDSVRFELEQTQSKAWVITRIERKH